MKAIRFRVRNFRNVDDSGWISLDRVTAFVGRNESGKTSLLKALHKFNPGTPEPYDARREFPRDRYTRDYVANGSRGGNWPVCSVDFEIPTELQADITDLLKPNEQSPNKVIVTRYYDGSFRFEYDSGLEYESLAPDPIVLGMDTFAKSAHRLKTLDVNQEEAIQAQRTELSRWATEWKNNLKGITDFRNDEGIDLLHSINREVENHSAPLTAEMVEALQEIIEQILTEAEEDTIIERVNEIIEQKLPVLIYFENYGVLDSAVWLPRFLEDLEQDASNSRVRTINAVFRHASLDPQTISKLGEKQADLRRRGENPEPEQITQLQDDADERAIQLSSASIEISSKFSNWWKQRRHQIRYHVDGDYFRIWVTDDLRQDVEIELEARSKGFQWFFSFYLVFLVESEDGHKDAILLLDEPGLHLHATAQQELISFFEKLSETNQLVYTTHSPFLIDGENLHRVRPVTEDDTGHSRVSSEIWPADRETIFPLQAAAGYAMIRGLFQHRKNVLVEGITDFYYLHALSHQCVKSGRSGLPDDIYITPCGGTPNVGHFASLFLSHDVRPLVLLDGDTPGRVRRDALMKELYAGYGDGVLMLDDVLNRAGQEVEIEDIMDEHLFLAGLKAVLGKTLQLNHEDRSAGSLPSQVKASAQRKNIDLPVGWKASVALHLVASWAENRTTLADEVLDKATALFSAITEAFAGMES